METAKAIITWTSPFVHYEVGLSRYFEQPHEGFIAIKFSIGSKIQTRSLGALVGFVLTPIVGHDKDLTL